MSIGGIQRPVAVGVAVWHHRQRRGELDGREPALDEQGVGRVHDAVGRRRREAIGGSVMSGSVQIPRP
jgi:hypothetical protein